MAGVATVAHDPLGHVGELVEQGNGVGEFVSLPGRDAKSDGAAPPVGD